jgi:hypothetical protein
VYDLADNGVGERLFAVFEDRSTKCVPRNSALMPGPVMESQPRTAQIDQGTGQDVPFVGNEGDDDLGLRKEAAVFT